MDSVLPSLTSHAHPLPKRSTPAFASCSLKVSKLPNADLIASAALPVGAPPAFGAIHVQKRLWFQWPPPLLRTAVRMVSGTLEISRHSCSTLFDCSSGCFASAAFSLSM